MKTTTSILSNAENTLFTARLGLKLLQGLNPNERRAGLRNLIVFGRAVTNVLQNLRSTEGQKLDDWYQPKVEEMKKDDILTFFYKLRSEILKEGTLNVHPSINLGVISVPAIMQRFPPPPNATRFFIGDWNGGSGWEVQIDEGYIEKFYVDISNNIPGLQFN